MSKAGDIASIGFNLALAGLAIGVIGKMAKIATKPIRKASSKNFWFS